jgi:hypothetical protein
LKFNKTSQQLLLSICTNLTKGNDNLKNKISKIDNKGALIQWTCILPSAPLTPLYFKSPVRENRERQKPHLRRAAVLSSASRTSCSCAGVRLGSAAPGSTKRGASPARAACMSVCQSSGRPATTDTLFLMCTGAAELASLVPCDSLQRCREAFCGTGLRSASAGFGWLNTGLYGPKSPVFILLVPA